MEKLTIGGTDFASRLFVGTGKFSSNAVMAEAVAASGSELVTVALKRLDAENSAEDDMLRHVLRPGVRLLPNTSGARDAREAAGDLALEAHDDGQREDHYREAQRHRALGDAHRERAARSPSGEAAGYEKFEVHAFRPDRMRCGPHAK